MTVRKIFIRFCNNIKHFSNEINKRGGWISFCGGGNFPKSVSVTSRLLERGDYLVPLVSLGPTIEAKSP